VSEVQNQNLELCYRFRAVEGFTVEIIGLCCSPLVSYGNGSVKSSGTGGLNSARWYIWYSCVSHCQPPVPVHTGMI